jgi:hypothetical protein
MIDMDHVYIGAAMTRMALTYSEPEDGADA